MPLTEAEKQRRLNAAADVASSVSTQSGRIAAAAAAYGTVLSNSPDPFSKAGAATQFGLVGTATLLSFSAQIVEQLLRPDPKNLGFNSTVDLTNYYISDKIPLWSPITTEIGEILKNSPWSESLKK